MRLEKPQALAEALLGAQGWTSAAVSQAMAAGHTQATPLHIPVPLYVLYWTADVSPAGHVRFRPDVYGWDRELLNALAHVAAPTALPGPPPAACDA
jgi:murein L,D-transpeptidase YcbB/YkuD